MRSDGDSYYELRTTRFFGRAAQIVDFARIKKNTADDTQTRRCAAWFDDIKIWKAEPDETWPARRAELKARPASP